MTVLLPLLFLLGLEQIYPDSLLRVRELIWSHREVDHSVLSLPPSQFIKRTGYKTINPRSLAHFKNQMNQSRTGAILLKQINKINETLPTIEKIRRVSHLMHKSEGWTCGTHLRLMDVIRDTTNPTTPEGCCSDYVQSFIALASLKGMFVRELFTTQHNMVEVYSPDTAKWVWFDPFYSLLAKGPAGELLSAIEVHTYANENKDFYFEYIGQAHNLNPQPVRHGRHEWEEYSLPGWASKLVVVLGNDVFSEDIYYERVGFLKFKAVLVGVGLLAQALPTYQRFDFASLENPSTLPLDSFSKMEAEF